MLGKANGIKYVARKWKSPTKHLSVFVLPDNVASCIFDLQELVHIATKEILQCTQLDRLE